MFACRVLLSAEAGLIAPCVKLHSEQTFFKSLFTARSKIKHTLSKDPKLSCSENSQHPENKACVVPGVSIPFYQSFKSVKSCFWYNACWVYAS